MLLLLTSLGTRCIFGRDAANNSKEIPKSPRVWGTKTQRIHSNTTK